MKSIQAGLFLSVLVLFSSAQAEVTPESIVDIFNRLDKLEKQNRELLGSNDELKNEIEQFKKTQKQSFLNIDGQIEQLSKTIRSEKSPAPTPKAVEKKPAPVATPVPATPVPVAPQVKPAPKAEEKVSAATPTPAANTEVVPASTEATANKKDREPNQYEKETYKAAFDKIKVSPTAATSAFREYIKMQPTSPLAANAQYWIGEIMYSHNNYNGAVQEFVKVLQSYKYSAKAPDAAIKLGYSFYALKKWDLARRTFEDVLRYFPENKNAVNLATKRLEKMKANGQ